MKKFQRGFTIFELMFAITGLISIALAGGLIYVGWHFLSKIW